MGTFESTVKKTYSYTTTATVLSTANATDADNTITTTGYSLAYVRVKAAAGSWSITPMTQLGNDAPPTRFVDAATFHLDGDGNWTQITAITAAGSYVVDVAGSDELNLPYTYTSGTPNTTVDVNLVAGAGVGPAIVTKLASIVTSVANIDTDTTTLDTTLTNRIGLPQTVTIANAVAITDTSVHAYALIADGGMTQAQVQRYSRFRITISTDHTNGTNDATALIGVYSAVASRGVLTVDVDGQMFLENTIIPDGGGDFVFTSATLGSSAVSTTRSIPGLSDVHDNLIVQIQYAVAPSSGSITIKVTMH